MCNGKCSGSSSGSNSSNPSMLRPITFLGSTGSSVSDYLNAVGASMANKSSTGLFKKLLANDNLISQFRLNFAANLAEKYQSKNVAAGAGSGLDSGQASVVKLISGLSAIQLRRAQTKDAPLPALGTSGPASCSSSDDEAVSSICNYLNSRAQIRASTIYNGIDKLPNQDNSSSYAERGLNIFSLSGAGNGSISLPPAP